MPGFETMFSVANMVALVGWAASAIVFARRDLLA